MSAPALPVEATGVGSRSRAGNAMTRARRGILDGARRGIERDGVRRLTMGEVARLGEVAKATVYNHVRNKDELLAAVLDDLVASAEEAAGEAAELAAALVAASHRLATDPVVRAVVAREPDVVGRVVTSVGTAPGDRAVAAVADLLRRHHASGDAAQADLVVGWLVQGCVRPVDGRTRRAQADRLSLALRPDGPGAT